MSTLQRSKSVSHNHATGFSRAAFTLIELLVVVAIIAVLISILLPSLKCARAQARAAVCGTTLHGFGTGFGTYFSENNDWIPGYNTTGYAIRKLGSGTVDTLRRPGLPVQSYDWITPIMRFDTDMGNNRAKRWKTILERYKCPSQGFTAVQYGTNPDQVDFDAEGKAWSAVSYLMPVFFQYWGQRESGQVIGDGTNAALPVRARSASPDWEVVTPSFKSRMTQIGTAARKLSAADGTRYLPQSLLLDMDLSPTGGTFGSFTEGSGWWSGSTAWGVKPQTQNWDDKPVGVGNESRGQQLGISYRHGCDLPAGEVGCQGNKGVMNGLFFDGHVSRMTDKQSREIGYWYPKGSVVRTQSEGLTFVPNGTVIQ